LSYRVNLCDDLEDSYSLFGVPRFYKWREVGTIYIQRLNELYSGNGQVGFLTWQFADGALVDPAQSSGVHPMLYISPNGNSAQP
jgi:HK97 family phage major capsid protein